MDQLSRQVAGLTPAQGAALEEHVLELAPRPEDRIRARPASGPAPLSFAQRRLWFMSQLEPGNPFYNVPLALRLSGPLDAVALERALGLVVERHEALRTTFAVLDGEPAQVVGAAEPISLPLVDLEGLPEAVRTAAVEGLVMTEARSPIDLASGPVLRGRLLRLAPTEHVLVLVVHHIAFDGWSARVLFREVGESYQAFTRGEVPHLPVLPIQYADYAVWQRQWYQGEVYQRQLAYWRERLGGAPELLELPTDRPRPAAPSYRGSRQSIPLPSSLAERLQEVGRSARATPFMTYLAAFQTLLGRYSEREDILVGAPIAGRTRVEIEGIIGCFINTLVLRLDLSGNPSFRELAGRVREVTLGAMTYADLPFERLVEELRPERDLSRHPLVQVMFQFTREPELTLAGIVAVPLRVDRGTAKVDLTLSVCEAERRLTAVCDYSTDLFDDPTISRLLGHFQTLLSGIAEDPERRVWDLPILTNQERNRALVGWNSVALDYPRQRCVHQLFEEQVVRTPEAPAVVLAGRRLTYRELNAGANRVAHALRRLGIGPDAIVAICFERSPELVVGLLGILKAGAAYLPLDPDSPRQRLAFMLNDADVRVLLTRERLSKHLPDHRARVVCLDADSKVTSQESTSNPVSSVGPENLAYVIFTSGSTGRPKGVLIEHRSLLNYVQAISDLLGLTQPAGFAMVQPPTVDSSVTALFPPLCTGGCLHLISEEQAADPAALGESFQRSPIDCLKIAPSHLAALVASPHPTDVLPRRWLILGGEASRREWVDRLQSLAPECRIYNHYGPTETTVGVLVYPLEREGPGARSQTVPIGRPLANCRGYVLSRRLHPVPVGVPGELYIGGACLARGYLRHPSLTAEKFIPDPFSREPGARLYASGDLVRYLEDGNIEFLGRADQQVKLRGFRIEPGEIEAALAQHPNVREAIVTARPPESRPDGTPADLVLVAYIVPDQRPGPTVAHLQRFLKERLPDYMVPAAFVVLDSFPRTPHGKVDRPLLPPPYLSRETLRTALVPPRTPVELVIAGIWSEVLGIDQVGIHDDFFALGGHSLLGTRAISSIRTVLGLDIPLRTLFDAPTVAELALAVDELKAREASRVPAERAPTPPG